MPRTSKWQPQHVQRQAAVDAVERDLTAEIEQLRSAAKSILWMAREYAEGGGSNGPEMQDYRAAAEIIGED